MNEICEGQRTNIDNLKVGMSIQSINFGSTMKIDSTSANNSIRHYY